MVLMSRPRNCPSGDGDSMRLMRGSTTPPNAVPFISPSAKSDWRNGPLLAEAVAVMLPRVRPQKLMSSLFVLGYVSSASSALLANERFTAAITSAGLYVDLLLK